MGRESFGRKNEEYAYYNELNRIADELATEAKEEVLQGHRKPGRHLL